MCEWLRERESTWGRARRRDDKTLQIDICLVVGTRYALFVQEAPYLEHACLYRRNVVSVAINARASGCCLVPLTLFVLQMRRTTGTSLPSPHFTVSSSKAYDHCAALKTASVRYCETSLPMSRTTLDQLLPAKYLNTCSSKNSSMDACSSFFYVAFILKRSCLHVTKQNIWRNSMQCC